MLAICGTDVHAIVPTLCIQHEKVREEWTTSSDMLELTLGGPQMASEM